MFLLMGLALAWSAPGPTPTSHNVISEPSSAASAAPVAGASATVTATSGVVPVAVPTPAVAPTPEPVKIAAAEGQQLFKNFDRAQSTYLNALKHRQKIEIDELTANQKHRTKEWERAEREKRLAYFEKNRAGKDRRVFVKEFIESRKIFQRVLKEELTTRKKDFATRRKSAVVELSESRKKFRAALAKGLRPDDSLWPQSQR